MRLAGYIASTMSLFFCCVSCQQSSDRQQNADDITSDAHVLDIHDVIKSDTATETDTIAVADTVAAIKHIPTEKELQTLQDLVSDRLRKLGKDNPLVENIWASSVLADAVEISLAINTPHWRNEFRKHISDSPYITFDGPSNPTPISDLVDSVRTTTAITLRPAPLPIPVKSESATFTLSNNSDQTIVFGVDYIIGYKGPDNCWYKLPNPGICPDLGIVLSPSGKYELKATLHPKLNDNTPGIYRLYKRVRFDKEKHYFWLMTEFSLR